MKVVSRTSRTSIFEVEIIFGDCDPAGIVFFPNFGKWMDASSANFFRSCGVPPWRDLFETRGILGIPVLDTQTKFKRSATYGERLQVYTEVIDWQAKVFRHQHRVMRGDELLCEGFETRAFVVRAPEREGGIKIIPVPADIEALCRGA